MYLCLTVPHHTGQRRAERKAIEHKSIIERTVISMIKLTRGPCRAKRKRPGDSCELFLVGDECFSGSTNFSKDSIPHNQVTEKRSIPGPKLIADWLQLLKDEAAERPDLRHILTQAEACLVRGDINGFNMYFHEEAVIRYKIRPDAIA